MIKYEIYFFLHFVPKNSVLTSAAPPPKLLKYKFIYCLYLFIIYCLYVNI